MSITNRKKNRRNNKTISDVTLDRIQAQSVSEASIDLGELVELPIEKIKPDPNQPRKDIKNIEGLAKTIEENELIQPISVRKIENGYMIIAGERRYHAFKFLNRNTIPCIIKNQRNDQDILILQLLENDQREQMNPFDVSEAINQLAIRDNLSVTNIAKKLGVSKDWVSIRKQLKNVDIKVKDLSGHANIHDVRTLVDLNRLNNIDSKFADKLIGKIKDNNLDGSYRQHIQKAIEKCNKKNVGMKSKIEKIQHIEYLDEKEDRIVIKVIGSKKPVIFMKSENFHKL